MNSSFSDSGKDYQHAVHRLTALWALNESGLGGIMHALKIPFTGFFVGGIAVVLIGLIAHFSHKSFRQIIQSTISVMIVKAIVSPQSPVPAYVAVAFQGFIGALMYSIISNFTLASIMFGFIALLESPVQKFLITTLIFGKSIWKALEIFFESILKSFSLNENISFSFWLVAIYCSMYALWGLILGWWISKLPGQIHLRREEIKLQYNKSEHDIRPKQNIILKRKKGSLLYVLYILLFIVTVFIMSNSEANSKAFYVVIRTIAVLLGWFVFVQPVLKFLIKRYTSKNKEEKKFRVEQLIASLPALKQFAQQAYYLSSQTHKGLARYREFVFILIVITLHSDAIEQ